MNLHFSDQGLTDKLDKPSIFLAGPSPRGRGEGFPADWRDEAFKIFEQRRFDGYLFVPRPTAGNSTNYDGQIEWELHHLDTADIIMFWVPRKLPGMEGLTTNCEFGLFIKKGNVVYGRPDWADRTRYLDNLYAKYMSKIPFDNLNDTIEAAIREATNNSLGQ